MKSQKERINEFMRLMNEASEKTGVTYAVEHGKPLIVFDLSNNEPVELEIVVGTEVKKEGGQTSIVTFDKSNVEE
jgi:uncharacterized protein YwlG (UPF0340 family)